MTYESLSARRAWIEIVDPDKDSLTDESLSARRAWIEMSISVLWMVPSHVALRKESVDRNPVVPAELTTLVKSLSARRAWIEI